MESFREDTGLIFSRGGAALQLETKVIETKRLRLRPFKMEDAWALYHNWASDPEVTKYLTWPAYRSQETAVERMHYYQDVYRKGGTSDWAIELKELGQVIGSIGVVDSNEGAKCVHVGYCIGRSWWHQGIMSEAFSAVIAYFFEETDVLRVEARHDPRNPHSGDVMRKCGLRYEGTLRQCDLNNQGICDAAYYGILKEEYLKGK